MLAPYKESYCVQSRRYHHACVLVRRRIATRYYIAIESIEEAGSQLAEVIPPSVHESPRRPRLLSRPIERFTSMDFTAKSTPMKAGTTDGVLRYMDTSGRGTSFCNDPDPGHDVTISRRSVTDPWTDKYVDDLSAAEHIRLEEGQRWITTGKEVCTLHASSCEEIFHTVRNNAEKIKMKVNNKKTQLICIAPNQVITTNSFIEIDGETIMSQDSLKLLGFVIGSDGTMNKQVQHIIKRSTATIWMIRRLKQAGIPRPDIVKIYSTIIRPMIEYGCQVYGPMITATQGERIERIQRSVMKIIFGFETSYAESLQLSGLERLSVRRDDLIRRFAERTSLNPRYEHWFPPLNPHPHDLRRRLRYREDLTRTERRKKGPIMTMRRILNMRQ